LIKNKFLLPFGGRPPPAKCHAKPSVPQRVVGFANERGLRSHWVKNAAPIVLLWRRNPVCGQGDIEKPSPASEICHCDLSLQGPRRRPPAQANRGRPRVHPALPPGRRGRDHSRLRSRSGMPLTEPVTHHFFRGAAGIGALMLSRPQRGAARTPWGRGTGDGKASEATEQRHPCPGAEPP
jgi:hypothetical protein